MLMRMCHQILRIQMHPVVLLNHTSQSIVCLPENGYPLVTIIQTSFSKRYTIYWYKQLKLQIKCVKFFVDDITYLLTMDKLWQTRRAPVPLDDQALPVEGEPLLADTMLLCFCTILSIRHTILILAKYSNILVSFVNHNKLIVLDMSSEDTELLPNQRLWSLQVCVSTFKQW